MAIKLYVLLTACALFLLVVIVWRLISRRASLPCPSWLAWIVEMENPFPSAYNTHTIVEHLDLQPGMMVLDAGCGPGRLTIPISKEIGPLGKVIAVDIQAGMLERANRKAKVANLTNIQFIQGKLGGTGLGKEQFDRALLVTVLGEIPDRHSALKEIHDALKTGGLLSITEILFDPHYQSRKAILHLASAVGFEEKAFFGNRFSFTLNLEKK